MEVSRETSFPVSLLASFLRTVGLCPVCLSGPWVYARCASQDHGVYPPLCLAGPWVKAGFSLFLPLRTLGLRQVLASFSSWLPGFKAGLASFASLRT